MTTIIAASRSHKAHLISRNEQFTPCIFPVPKPQNAVVKLLNRLSQTLVIWTQRARQRRQLAEMEQERLNDIGISPSQVSKEIAKPFWVK